MPINPIFVGLQGLCYFRNEPVIDAMQNFILTLVSTSPRRLIESQFASPFQAFLAGATIRKDRQYMEPRQMVGMMCSLKYIMKCAVFWKSKQESVGGADFST